MKRFSLFRWMLLLPFIFGGNLLAKNSCFVTEDFHKASALAKSYQKPLVLLFIGSDWCPYSQKLLEKMFNQEEFSLGIEKDILFVKIDFPDLYPHPSKAKIQENFCLKERFQVDGFPTLVLVDENLEEISRIGFSEERGAEYAKRIKNLIRCYKEIKDEIDPRNKLSFSQLESRYHQAKELGSLTLQRKIIDLGLKQDKELFFHLEAYQLYEAEEKKQIREKIQQLLAKEGVEVRVKIALFDYQEAEKEKKWEFLKKIAVLVSSLQKEQVPSSFSDRLCAWLGQEIESF